MKLIVRRSAQGDLDRIAERIGKDNPRAAASIVSRVRDRIDVLRDDRLAHMGRPGLIEGTRELVEAPYIIVYRVDDRRREVIVLSIVHGAQRRKPSR